MSDIFRTTGEKCYNRLAFAIGRLRFFDGELRLPHFVGRILIISLSSIKEKRGGVSSQWFQTQIPSPQPSPRLGGERELCTSVRVF